MIYSNLSCITWFTTIQKSFRDLELNPNPSLLLTDPCVLHPCLSFQPNFLTHSLLSLACCQFFKSLLPAGGMWSPLPGMLFPCPWYVCLFFILWDQLTSLFTEVFSDCSLQVRFPNLIRVPSGLSSWTPSQIRIICLLLEYMPLWTATIGKQAHVLSA